MVVGFVVNIYHCAGGVVFLLELLSVCGTMGYQPGKSLSI